MRAVVKAFGNQYVKEWSYNTKITPNFKTVYNVGYDQVRGPGGKKRPVGKKLRDNRSFMHFDDLPSGMARVGNLKLDVNDLRYMEPDGTSAGSLPMGPAYINKDGYIVRRVPDMSKRVPYPMRQPTMEVTVGDRGKPNLAGWTGKLKGAPDFGRGGGMEKPHNIRRRKRDEKHAPTPNTEPRETVPWVKPYGKSQKAKPQHDPELRFNEAEKKRVANMKVPYAQRDMETPLGKYMQSLDRGGKVDRKARRIDEWRRHTPEGEWRSFDNPKGPSAGKTPGTITPKATTNYVDQHPTGHGTRTPQSGMRKKARYTRYRNKKGTSQTNRYTEGRNQKYSHIKQEEVKREKRWRYDHSLNEGIGGFIDTRTGKQSKLIRGVEKGEHGHGAT